MTMWDERNNLPSIRYWRSPPECVPQRFYVAFCLLMSSVQDWILGQKERKSNNLNWSATCSYYSLVHGGRLLCFLALGDFPTSHARLRQLFAGHSPRNRGRATNKYPFDWLKGFTEIISGGRQIVLGSEDDNTADHRHMIATYLDNVRVPESERRITKFGSVLSAAGPLRNDSNYEALLIAHEYQHVSISKAFDALSKHLATAAESQRPLIIDAFNGFRHHDPDLPQPREDYEAFLHDYVQDRITFAIRRKLSGSVVLESHLDRVIHQLGTCATGASYQNLEDHVSMGVFEGKAQLMRHFEERILHLERAVRS